MKEPKKLPLTENPRNKEPQKLPLTPSNNYDIDNAYIWVNNENNRKDNKKIVSELESHETN
jgi:hypothetical protein